MDDAKHESFEWKTLRFSWSYHRAAYKASVRVGVMTYWLCAREDLPGHWEVWWEMPGANFLPASRHSSGRDDALSWGVGFMQEELRKQLEQLAEQT